MRPYGVTNGASLHENATTADLLGQLDRQGQGGRLQLVIVDRGVSARGAEVAHGRLLRQRRLARSFENTLESATGWLQVACLAAALDAIFSPSPPWRRRTRPAGAR